MERANETGDVPCGAVVAKPVASGFELRLMQ
jgi:hypothetical protein